MTKQQETKSHLKDIHGINLSLYLLLMEKGSDFWFFGLSGEIMHNPESFKLVIPKDTSMT